MEHPHTLAGIDRQNWIGASVLVLDGAAKQIVGKTGTVREICDNGVEVLVAVPGERNAMYGEWPVLAEYLRVDKGEEA